MFLYLNSVFIPILILDKFAGIGIFKGLNNNCIRYIHITIHFPASRANDCIVRFIVTIYFILYRETIRDVNIVNGKKMLDLILTKSLCLRCDTITALFCILSMIADV